MSSDSPPSQASVLESAETRHIQTPKVKWDPETIGPGCKLAHMDTSLYNDAVRRNAAPDPNPFKFPRTRALIDLNKEDLVYWEVWWTISERKPRTTTSQSGSQCFLQLGIAPYNVLFDVTGDAPLEQLNTAGVTLLVEEDLQGNKCTVKVAGGPAQQEPEELEDAPCDTSGCRSPLGFLFDGSRSTLWVTDAWAKKVLMMRKVNTVQTLHPFVCVGKREEVGKKIVVTLKDVNLNILGQGTFLQQLLRDSK